MNTKQKAERAAFLRPRELKSPGPAELRRYGKVKFKSFLLAASCVGDPYKYRAV